MIIRTLEYQSCTWPLHSPFVIARSSRDSTESIQINIQQNDFIGRAECVPTARYGESIDSVKRQIESCRESLENGLSIEQLQSKLPAGAARNGIDCALWDLEAKLNDKSVAELINQPTPSNISTVQTISIGSPASMGKVAKSLADYPILKVKLNQDDIITRLNEINKNAPNSKLLIDANESWNIELLQDHLKDFVKLPILMIEQPLPVGEDHLLNEIDSTIPFGADESFHTTKDIDKLSYYYQVLNIKLDKCGGLTEASKIIHQARLKQMSIMLGCMVGTSLSMAPALLLASQADYVDLDGPTFLCKDIENGLIYKNGSIANLPEKLWGSNC